MLSRTHSRGADALARVLQQAGVKRVFALSGNHVMSVFDALLDTGIELIHTRHEAATVHMADAYARITGQPGIALVTGGPGHANAVSALYTAQMSESPVILLSGHAPNDQIGTGAFQEMRQAEMAAPVTKAAWASHNADSVGPDLARAIRIALGGRPGPVNLNLPTDALHSRTDGASAKADFAPEREGLTPEQAQAIVERLTAAARPVVLAGPYSLTRSGRARLVSLEATLGVPVVGMESPRGLLDPSLGAFGEALAQADCVLLLGKRLDFTLKFGKAPAFSAGCEFLQVDPEAAEIERSRSAVGERLRIACVADVIPTIDALCAQGAAAKQKRAWIDEVDAAIAYRPAAWETARASAGRVHPAHLARPLQSILDNHPDAILIADGGEIGQWAQACLNAPHRVINGVAGSIGAGLPFAIGARVAESRAPIVAVMGDGTFGFHTAELDTAVTRKLPFLAVIGNDARWNAEHQIQIREYGPDRAHGCELRELRYDLIAQAFGAWGERVTTAGEVLPAAQRAVASGRPACLDVLIDGLPAPQISRKQ